MPARMHFSMKLSRKPINGFMVVMLGSYGGNSGSDNTGTEEGPSLHGIEVDTIDDVIGKLQPSLSLALDGGSDEPLTLRFSSLDDFHPDQLLDRLSDYRSITGAGPALSAAGEQDASLSDKRTGEDESQQETLSRLLGQRPLGVEQRRQSGSSASGARHSMISDVVRRLAQNASGPDSPETTAATSADEMGKAQDKTRLLRNLLHHAGFQRLESRWRSVDWLMHTLEPDPAIRCYLLNITRTGLERMRTSHQEPSSSPLYHLLRDVLERQDTLETGFMLIDDHEYGPDREAVAMLDWMGSLVACFDGALVAGADAGFLQEDHVFADGLKDWRDFRQRDAAEHTAMLYPRILLRLPYGAATDPIVSQSFEELDENWSRDELLWGNPAYAQAALTLNHWVLRDSMEPDPVLTGLPAYSYERDGESHLQPCTRSVLSEKQIEQLLSLGLIPVIGSRNRNSIQLPWFQFSGVSDG